MILDEIVAKTKERMEEKQKEIPLSVLKQQVEKLSIERNYPFEQALRKQGMSFIMEVKKASPSKGLIAKDFDYLAIAKEYEAIGASAISVLTEPYFFLGSDTILKEIAQQVHIPILRKDFVVNEYMIYEAKLLGASAVLLICSVLDDEMLLRCHQLTEALGMNALVEAHDAEEIQRAVKIGAKIIGVNNRDLRSFHVDMGNSLALRSLVKEDILFVSESGISGYADIKRLEENQVNAVLIGETLMRSNNKQKTFDMLRGYAS